MKNKTINLVGKHITENIDDIQDGYVEVQFDVNTLLSDIDSDDIRSFARSWCGLIDADDLSSFDEDDLVAALKKQYYHFQKSIDELDDEDIIEEYFGRDLGRFNGETYLDDVDAQRLQEITDKFINSTWAEREEMYKQII